MRLRTASLLHNATHVRHVYGPDVAQYRLDPGHNSRAVAAATYAPTLADFNDVMSSLSGRSGRLTDASSVESRHGGNKCSMRKSVRSRDPCIERVDVKYGATGERRWH
jgi:hypothetical protein